MLTKFWSAVVGWYYMSELGVGGMTIIQKPKAYSKFVILIIFMFLGSGWVDRRLWTEW